jgi:3'-5' exonuclease
MDGAKILVFDIETYPDIPLIEAQGTNLSSFREQLKQETGTDFLPPIYHVPIALAVLKVERGFRELTADVLTTSPGNESSLVEAFWRNCEEVLGTTDGREEGLLVSFNGMGFDVPVLELRALKYALRGNTRARDRRFHFDVPLFLANYEPSRRRGLHLSTLSKLAGLPGKVLLDGGQVQSRFESGALDEIGRYCLLDVLETYLLFLRCQLLCGMNSGTYETAVRSFASFLNASTDPSIRALTPYLEEYLKGNAEVQFFR